MSGSPGLRHQNQMHLARPSFSKYPLYTKKARALEAFFIRKIQLTHFFIPDLTAHVSIKHQEPVYTTRRGVCLIIFPNRQPRYDQPPARTIQGMWPIQDAQFSSGCNASEPAIRRAWKSHNI